MKHTTSYSVGGQIVNVPHDEMEEFNGVAAATGVKPVAVNSFRVTGADGKAQTVNVPETDMEEFNGTAKAGGYSVEPLKTFTMQDGTRHEMTDGEYRSFLRSDEYHRSQDYKDRVAELAAKYNFGNIDQTPGEKTSDTLAEKAHQNVSDAGGTALGRAAGGFLEKFARFMGMIASNMTPLGAESANVNRAQTLGGGNGADSLRNNVGQAVGDAIRSGTNTLFPEGKQGTSGLAQTIGKANELGIGLGEFALTPTPLLVGGAYAESWTDTYDAAKANGADDGTAAELANANGVLSAGVTAAFKTMPTNRIMKGLGIDLAAPAVKEAAKVVDSAAKLKSSTTAAIARQQLAHAAKSAAEMGVLTDFQGIYGGAIMQMAEKGTDDPSVVDWAAAADRALPEAANQAAMGAVLSLLPTPIRIQKARKAIDQAQSLSLKTDAGIQAFAEVNPEGVDKLLQAYKKDGTVSRKAAREAGLPEMGQNERNLVAERLAKGRDELAKGNRAKISPENEQMLDETIAGLTDNGEAALSAKIDVLNAMEGDASKLNDPEWVQRKAMESLERAGKETAKQDAMRTADAEAEAGRVAERQGDVDLAVRRDDAARGQQKRAERKAQQAEWEKQEAERKAREAAEEAGVPEEIAGSKTAQEQAPEEPVLHDRRTDFPGYAEWLRKGGKKDSDKNWRRFARENGIEEDEIESYANDAEKKKVEAKRREDERARKQAASEESDNIEEIALASREETAHDAKERQVTADWEAAEAERKAKAQEASRKGAEERARRKAEQEEYEAQQKVRAGQEAAEQEGFPKKPVITGSDAVPPSPKERMANYPDYAEWIRKNGKKNSDKNWNKFVLENGMDPKLTVERGKGPVVEKSEKTVEPKAEPTPEQNVEPKKDAVGQERPIEQTPEPKSEAVEVAKPVESATPETPAGENGVYTVNDNPFALRVFREKMSKSHLSIESADRMEKLASDENVISWAKKQGREVVDGKASPQTVREYLKDQVAKAKEATKRLFSDADVEIVDANYDPAMEKPSGALELKSGEGKVVGTFDPATKKVTLYRGADAKTVFHELVGHGVEDWAKRNSPELHAKLMDLAKTAPKEIVDDIRKRYDGADEATIANEIIARIAEGKGLENIKLKDAPKHWYAKAYVAVRDAIIGLIQKIGGNRINLAKISEMTPSEAMEYLTKQIGKGRTLGEIGSAKGKARMGIGEKWANEFFDRFTSVYKVSKEAGDAKTLQAGREAEFQKMKFDPRNAEFKRLLKEGDVSVAEVDEYMKSLAAAERNARLAKEKIDKVHESTVDMWNGSGLTPEEAQASIDHFHRMKTTNPKRYKAIKEAADFLWKMQDEGLQARVEAGLLTQAEADAFRAAEEYHVPFRSAIDENGDYIPWGRGLSEPEFHQAKGRHTESGSPSAFIFEEYADAHLRGIENKTRKVLADAIAKDSSIGTIDTNPELREMRVRGDGGSPNVVSYKTVGKDGKTVTRNIVLNGERGGAIASAYTNLNLHNKNPFVNKLRGFMRFWSATATELSPTFALRNMVADNVDLGLVVTAERGLKGAAKFMKAYAKNRWAVKGDVWHYAKTGEVPKGSALEQFIKEGGMIGGFAREGYGDLTSQFSADRLAKEMASGKSKVAAIAKWVPEQVKALNSYSELMTRVASFKTNVEAGMSPKEAALWSRRISVDFNRKGNMTPIMNTLFMFSNSQIGATMRQLEAVKNAWKTKEGRIGLACIAAFGFSQGILEHVMNLQDEERNKVGETTGKDVTEHTRKTSIYARVGGRTFRAPVHEDPLMKIVYACNTMARTALGDISTKEASKEVVGGALETVPVFFGQGTKAFEAGWNTWVPTALQPIVQSMENKDYAGRQLVRPKYNEATPDAYNGRKSTSDVYKDAAKFMNDITGGNKGKPGMVDVAPETLKLAWESVAKNMGKDYVNVAQTGYKLLTGQLDDIDSRNVPVVRDFVRTNEGNDNRYFDSVRQFKQDKEEHDKMFRDWSPEQRKEYMASHPWLRKNGMTSPRVQQLQTQINELRRMEGGEAKLQNGGWRAKERTKEDVDKLTAKRRKLQAKVIELMTPKPKKD